MFAKGNKQANKQTCQHCNAQISQISNRLLRVVCFYYLKYVLLSVEVKKAPLIVMIVEKYSKSQRRQPGNELFQVLMWGAVEVKKAPLIGSMAFFSKAIRLPSSGWSSRNIPSPKAPTWEYTILGTYVRGSWGIQGPCVDLHSLWLLENLPLAHICLQGFTMSLNCHGCEKGLSFLFDPWLLLYGYCHICHSAPSLFFFSSFSSLPLPSLLEAVWEAVKFSLKDSRVLIPLCQWEGIEA